MHDSERHIVMDLAFEAALGEASRAICKEGLAIIARIDVRDHFWRDLGRDSRHYTLIEAWSPELAFEALQHDLELGAVFPTRFAIYELADGATAIVVADSPLVAEPRWRREDPALTSIADQEAERVARVLAHLRQAGLHEASAASVA